MKAFTLQGGDRLLRHLARIARVGDDTDIAEAGADIFVEEMQDRVRRLDDDLYNSLAVRFDGGEVLAGAGPEGFHGYFLELGTSKMPPYPWLRPAFDQGRRPAAAAMRRELGRQLGRIWGR